MAHVSATTPSGVERQSVVTLIREGIKTKGTKGTKRVANGKNMPLSEDEKLRVQVGVKIAKGILGKHGICDDDILEMIITFARGETSEEDLRHEVGLIAEMCYYHQVGLERQRRQR